MFILQRTNFVSTKNIDNCVLLFLYVLPIDDQAEVRRNADIQVPEECHWPSHYIECMMKEKEKRSPDYYDLVGIFYELACTQRPRPDGLVILRNQNQTLFSIRIPAAVFISVIVYPPTLPFITISFFLKNARAYCTFYNYLAKPLSKVHVSNNRSNTDYYPQDIPNDDSIASPSSEHRCQRVKFDKGPSAERKVTGSNPGRINSQTLTIAEENVRLFF